MDFTGFAGDDTWALLGRVVVMTLFYAALAWVPLRGTTALVKRVHSTAIWRVQRRRAGRSRLTNRIR